MSGLFCLDNTRTNIVVTSDGENRSSLTGYRSYMNRFAYMDHLVEI